MIFDKTENIDKYSIIPEDIKIFIKKALFDDISAGRYELNNGNYVNIDEYFTRPASDCRLEAHKKYIDIQLLLDGKEKLQYTYTDGLKISENYDENCDIMFFDNPEYLLNSVILNKNTFVLLYPHEAHKPGINYNETGLKIKKAVFKIKV